jgi:hypothetical protein
MHRKFFNLSQYIWLKREMQEVKKVPLFEYEIPHYRKQRSAEWVEQKQTR